MTTALPDWAQTSMLPAVSDCRGDFVVPAMKWLDEHGGSYQAWVWNAWGCANLQLMTDYRTGRPTGYGRAIRNHFRELAAP